MSNIRVINYDCCIVGAGIAGLILFDELVKRNVNVCLIESGDDSLNKGYVAKESFGHKELHSYRCRGIGGTGQKWGGGCALFEPEDFDGWPFSYDTFLKYYEKAARTLDIEGAFLGRETFNPTYFDKDFKSNSFKTSFWAKTKLTENKLLHKLLRTNQFRMALENHCFNNFTLIKICDNRLLFKNKHQTLLVNCDKCILCCGGLETARLLLNNDFKNRCIGKYYSPHLNLEAGTYHLNSGVHLTNDDPHRNKSYYTTLLCESPNKLDLRLQMFPPDRLICQGDQTPNENSGIRLSEEKDIYGQNLITLNHYVPDDELENVKKCLENLNYDMKGNRIGHISFPSNINDYKKRGMGASHHIGMTRIGSDKDSGVVDEKLKVYDSSSLYILSTSVFPTYSHAPPTFTLVALIYYFLDVNFEG